MVSRILRPIVGQGQRVHQTGDGPPGMITGASLAVPVAIVVLAGSFVVVLFLRRNTLLASALFSALLIAASYAALNVVTLEERLNVIPSFSSVLKDLLLVGMLPTFAAGIRALGGRWSFVLAVVWPVSLALMKIGTWSRAVEKCGAAPGLVFDHCSYHVASYAVGELVMLVSVAFYGVGLLRVMRLQATLTTLHGRAVAIFCISLASLIAWLIVAAAGVVEVWRVGEFSPLQQLLRPATSVLGLFCWLLGLFWVPVGTLRRTLWFRTRVKPVADRLEEILPLADGLSGSPQTQLMDHLGLALKDADCVAKDHRRGGEEEMALWLLGRRESPSTIPFSASAGAQAGWLIRVASIMRHENSRTYQ